MANDLRTRDEIEAALAEHAKNREQIISIPERRAELARTLGWSVDRLLGYSEGVEYVYRWVLRRGGKK